MKSIFQWSENQPYHISVGVLLTNDKGEICVHHIALVNEAEPYPALQK